MIYEGNTPECLDERPGDPCKGSIDYWTVGDSIKSWPRCDYHGMKRQNEYEGSLEQEAQSPIAPSWFDPSYAGEQWNEE